MANTFIAPGQIISGSRTLDMAADTMAKMGKKALVVTDDVMKNLGNLDKVTDMLEKAGVSYAVFTGVTGEPDDRGRCGCVPERKLRFSCGLWGRGGGH